MEERKGKPIDRDYELWVLLRQTSDAIRRARENELRKIGISRIQAAVLFALKTIEPPVTPAKISRWLFREPHSVSGLLDRMERQGLITKAKDLDRRNLVRVSLTPKGEEAYEFSKDRRSMREVLSVLTPEERDVLRGYMLRLRGKALDVLKMEVALPFP